MSWTYRLMYAVGFAPWDFGIPEELKELVEGAQALQPGKVLDLGSGMGAKAIYLAEHSWRVTGIEAVPRAIAVARRRAAAAAVTVEFRGGDVTRLDSVGLTDKFDLIFDFGCFHGLGESQRAAYAAGVDKLAAPRATILMMAFSRALPPVPRGVVGEELRALFPDWRLAWERPATGEGTRAMRRAGATWFRLERGS